MSFDELSFDTDEFGGPLPKVKHIEGNRFLVPLIGSKLDPRYESWLRTYAPSFPIDQELNEVAEILSQQSRLIVFDVFEFVIPNDAEAISFKMRWC